MRLVHEESFDVNDFLGFGITQAIGDTTPITASQLRRWVNDNTLSKEQLICIILSREIKFAKVVQEQQKAIDLINIANRILENPDEGKFGRELKRRIDILIERYKLKSTQKDLPNVNEIFNWLSMKDAILKAGEYRLTYGNSSGKILKKPKKIIRLIKDNPPQPLGDE